MAQQIFTIRYTNQNYNRQCDTLMVVHPGGLSIARSTISHSEEGDAMRWQMIDHGAMAGELGDVVFSPGGERDGVKVSEWYATSRYGPIPIVGYGTLKKVEFEMDIL